MENRIGESNKTHQGFIMTIIGRDKRYVVIQFNDRYNTIWHTTFTRFKRGHVNNPSVICLYGNIAYKEDINNNPMAFEKWRAMLDRCYGIQEGNNRVYKGCKVSDEWLNFENFVKWFNDNYYEIQDTKMELDKDLFGDGKLYSSDTCVFIPHKLNSQLTKHPKQKYTELPVGVTYHKKQNGDICYRVTKLSKNQLFEDINKAQQAYKDYIKEKYKQFAIQYKNVIPTKLYQKLVNFSF